MTWFHVVPINIVHIYLPNNFALVYYSTTKGLLGEIIFKYPLISTLPIILQAEGILLNIYHVINVYWDPTVQGIMS